jgi:hypothetical protein
MLAGGLAFKSLIESIGSMPGAKITLRLLFDSRTLVNKITKQLNNGPTALLTQYGDNHTTIRCQNFLQQRKQLYINLSVTYQIKKQ